MKIRIEVARRIRAVLITATLATALCGVAFAGSVAAADPAPDNQTLELPQGKPWPQLGNAVNMPACGVLSPGAAPEAEAAVSRACGLIGTAYSWGGGHGATPGPSYGQCDAANNAPNDCHVFGLDCSGFTRYSYYLATGLDMGAGATRFRWNSDPAVARFMAADGLAPLLPGDLLYFGSTAASIHHTAIYLGNGYLVESPFSGSHVSVNTVSAHNDYFGAVRIYPQRRGSSLSGDGRAEFVSVFANGEAHAWYNAAGFAPMPWGGDNVVIGSGFTGSTTKFGDLDGDGKNDVMVVYPNGEVHAWHNIAGFGPMPWGGDNVIVATGITDPARVRFADLDGDGKAEVITVEPDGTVHAWHNIAGFAPMPWGGDSVVIGTGFDPNNTFLADLDGDRKADLISIHPNGEVHAWHNIAGFAPMPWGGDNVIIATGFTGPTTKFGDLDGDGKADVISIHPNGEVHAWHNIAGFAPMPWGGDNITIATGITDPTTTFLA
jgi:hypothetical protein